MGDLRALIEALKRAESVVATKAELRLLSEARAAIAAAKGGRDIKQSRINTLHEALDAEEAKVAALVEALTPFAEYMADGMDQDYNGAPLPDSEGVGWIYLTHGDFRRARAAIAAAKEGA